MRNKGNGQGTATVTPPAHPADVVNEGEKFAKKQVSVDMSMGTLGQMGATFEAFGVITDKRVHAGESKKTGKPYKMHFVELGFLGSALEFMVEEGEFDTIQENHFYKVAGDLRPSDRGLRGHNLSWTEVSLASK